MCSTLVLNLDVLAIEFLCCSEGCLGRPHSALQKSYKEHFNVLELYLKEVLTPTGDLLLCVPRTVSVLPCALLQLESRSLGWQKLCLWDVRFWRNAWADCVLCSSITELMLWKHLFMARIAILLRQFCIWSLAFKAIRTWSYKFCRYHTDLKPWYTIQRKLSLCRLSQMPSGSGLDLWDVSSHSSFYICSKQESCSYPEPSVGTSGSSHWVIRTGVPHSCDEQFVNWKGRNSEGGTQPGAILEYKAIFIYLFI